MPLRTTRGFVDRWYIGCAFGALWITVRDVFQWKMQNDCEGT
jgi:hypothetical protein